MANTNSSIKKIMVIILGSVMGMSMFILSFSGTSPSVLFG